MYSVVVLMALTTGGETPDRHGYCGGYSCGYSSCGYGYGYCGYSSCGYGYCGSYAPCYSYSYCAPVAYTCYPYYHGCATPMIVVPEKKKEGKKKEEETSATLVVSLPADATLTIDGAPTVSTSATRVFISPALEEGKEFHYTLKAQVMREGKPVVAEKKIAVRAGSTVDVSLTIPAAEVAAR